MLGEMKPTAGTVQLTMLSNNVWFASRAIPSSPYCPNGVFSPTVAVDRTSEEAALRANFEAAERYALAAIEDGHHFTCCTDTSEIISPALRMSGPFRQDGKVFGRMMPIQDAIGETAKFASVSDIFAPYPINSYECQWHPSTNGVAVGPTYEAARISSLIEFVERHSIMKFWFFKGSCRKVPLQDLSEHLTPEMNLMQALGYELNAFEISETPLLTVVLVLAVQKEGHYPYLVCAAGASFFAIEAIQKAVKETVQTLVASSLISQRLSSWVARGEKVSNLDHRMLFYGNPSNRARIDRAIADLDFQCHGNFNVVSPKSFSTEDLLDSLGATAAFINISPSSWNGQLYCVRCLSSTLLPLIIDESLLTGGLSEERIRAFPMPHPFP